MNSIRTWYLKNRIKITWFIVGWLALAAIYDFGRGDYPALAIDLVLIGLNLALND